MLTILMFNFKVYRVW